MLTYLLLSNDTQAKGDDSCPVRRCFEEFTSHQLDLNKPMEHISAALIKSEAHARRRGTNRQAPITWNPSSQYTCFIPALALQLLRPQLNSSPRQLLE